MRIVVEGTCEREHPAQIGTLELEARAESAAGDAAEAMHRAAELARRVQGEAEHEVGSGRITEVTVGAPTTSWWREDGTAPGGAEADGESVPTVRVGIPLSVKAGDPVLLGTLAARWGGLPGLIVTGARWDLEPGTRSDLQDEALRGALATARHRGEVLARSVGGEDASGTEGSRVGIEEIEDRSGGGGGSPFLMRSAMAGGPGGDVELEIRPEPVTVRAEVRVVLSL